MPDKIDQLYEALRKDGAVTKSRDNFRSYVLAPGDEGVQNRKALYEALKADGAVTSPTQDEFERRLEISSATSSPSAQTAPGNAPNAVKQQDAAAGNTIGKLQGAALGGAIGALAGGGANRSWGEVTNATPTPTPVIEPQQPTDVKQKIQPAELTEKEVGDDLAFMREANKSRGDILEAAPQDQNGRTYWMPHYDKNWKAGYSQSWGKIKGLFDGLDYGKKDVTSSLDAAVKSRYDGMSDQELERELQKLSKEYKAGEWGGVEDSLRAHIQRLQMNLIAHEYGFKNYGDMMSRRGEAEYEMYKYHPAFDQEWLATYNGGPGENPLVNMGKEIVKKQLIEDTMNGVPRPEGYYQSLPFRDKEFSKRYASWALKRAKVLGSQAFADVWDNGIKEWEAYIGAGLLESGAEEAMAQGTGYRDVGIAGGKYNSDFDAAAATAWNMAEDEYRRLSGAHSNEIWGDYASMGGGREARMVASGEWAVSNMADRLSSHDLDKMIDNAWKSLGESKQKQIVLAAAQNLKQQYPGMSPAEMVKTAQSMVRQQTIQRVLDYAKEQNAPKNVVDYFARKVLEQNSIFKIQEAMARSRAGTSGDWQAREMAMQEYGKNHRVAGVTGTVVGMGLDPVTYISAGVGKGAAAGTVKLIEKLGGAAGRKWLTTTAGKVVVGAAGGAANLGTFEGLNETLNQLRWGGSPAVDLKTGLIKTTGYDAGKVGKAIFHGTTMGAGTGIVAPLVGNVWSPFMEATSSTAGKMAVKTGELFTGTIAEGTIFSIPDVYNAYTESENIIKSFSDKKSRNYISDEQERAKAIAKVREQRNETMLDAWSESVATMAGFKMKHVGQRLYELSQSGNGRAGFETRLRYMLDRKPDLALTKDEQAELERGGYTDLKELVNEYVKAEKNRRANSKPVVTGRPRTMELGTREEDMPYNRFVDLMNDGSISEAARAKMYYYITGHALPMSTVMYGQLTENKDRDGNVKGYTVQSIGANGVVTSREFTSRKRAENELQKVNRQIELNTIDIGERYNESIGNSTKELREDIGQKYGVDVEKALKKEPKRRSAGEQMALDEYMRRLFPEKEAREEDAEDVTFSDDADVPNETTNGFTDEPTDEGAAIVVETLSRTGEDGMVHPAVLKGEDESQVNIVSGNVVTLADGTIDVANSDQDIIIVDAKGQRLMININDIASIGTPIDPNAAMAAVEQVNTEPADAGTTPTSPTQPTTQEGATGIEVGGRYQVADGEGTHEVEVLRDNGNGTLEVRVDGEQHTMPLDILQQMLGIDVALSTPQTGPAAANQQQGPVAQSGPVATNDMVEADVPEAGSERYSVDPNADERAMGMAGFSEQDIAATVDYLNGKLGVREYLETVGISADTLDATSDEQIASWVNSIVERASEFITDATDEAAAVQPPTEHHQISGIENEPFGSVTPRSGRQVDLYRQQEDKDGVRVTRVVGIRDGNTVSVPTAYFPMPDGYTIDEEYRPEGEVLGVKELREVADGASATIVVRDDTGIATYDVKLNKVEAMPMGDDGEADFASSTPEQGHRYIYEESGLPKAMADATVENGIKDAEAAIKKHAKKEPGAPKPDKIQEWRSKHAQWEAEGEHLRQEKEYWEKVKAVEHERQAQAAAERKVKDAEVAAQAQAEEQARQATELAKQQEQAERGAGAVHPAIAEKWGKAPKVEGYDNEITLANGEKIQGRYVMTESGAATPSHNALREFEKSEGFPVDENGNTVNDRDYERDKDAQNITRKMGDTYDSRAIQQVPVVSRDGVVLSGNGRTMAGELAASNNTDKAYIDHLKKYGKQFGFTPEQVSSMQHPRVVFVPDADMPYTTDTFAKFNAQEMKGQSKTEQAVKLGKVVDDATFNQVVRAINDHEALGDFYGDTKAATEAINALRRAGAINDMQYAEMFDGDAVSDRGRQIIENMLIGKAFEGNPDVIRMLTEYKSFRQSVVTALNEISTNVALGKDYSLENELAQAIELAYKARKAGFKENELVSPYATQLNLFPFEDGETVADYNNAAVLLLADMLNDKRPTLLKKKLQDYNQQSAESAAGQMDIFAGGVKEKKEIIKTVLNTLHNGETEETSRPEQRGSVADERGGEASLQKDGAADTGSAALATPQAEPSIDAAIVEAGKETNTEPTDAQKEAGNYKKGHVKIDGFDVSIEQPKGSVRSGVDATGKAWSQKMNNTYGYIRGTEGVDGDHIDVFLSDNLDGWNGTVYVVDQVNKDGSFDEHKVMYGFNSEEEARKAYLSNYEDGWDGLGAITAVSKDEFKKWIDSSHRKTKPFAEYKNVKVGETQEQEPKQQGTLFPATEQQPSSKSETKPRTTEKQPAEAPKERIDDVGEKIEGAKKDLAKKMGERINLDADTFPKMFPKYDLKKLISQGLDPNLAVMTKMLRQMAQADYKHYSKKRMYGKSYALRAARFYAAYAKQVLEAGDSNVDFKSEGLGFTDYGKQFVELNKRLFEELYKKLGDDLFDLDLAGVKIQPLSQKEGSTWFRRNQETGEMEPYNPAYAFVGPRGQNYYEANELDKALQEGVEQVTKSIDYKKTHPYKLGHYYKPGIKNSDYVGVKLGGKVVPLTEPMTSSEVRKYMSEHNAELQAKASQLDEQRKLDKKKGGTGEGRWKPELTLGGGRPRVGVDRRGGVDVEPEEFRKAFSFRGVQFGNYVTQRERQRFLNEAYDALMDMAELLGISPRAIAIDGRLGFAIGARGGGKANAHYEPIENVINLTKSKGAGSLAHEWFHALDYYFNRSNKKPTTATANKSAEQFPSSTRNEMRKAFLDLMSAIKNSDYFKRSENLEMKLRSGKLDEGYYDKPTELAARAFQDYVVRKLADQGKINDFLSSFTSEEEWNGEPENYPFPIGEEAEKIDEKFDALFDAMQERTDEEGNTILYHLGKDNEVLTDTEVALRDGLVEVLRGAGIEVVTDEAEGQRVLDAANGHVQAMGSRVNKRMAEIDALLKGREMNKLQHAVVDVFSGKKDNVPIDIERADGNRHVIMRQGNEQGAGTKHSVFRHYGTTRGVITADDILLVPEVLTEGIREQDGKRISYSLEKEGVKYTVTTEMSGRGERFTNFFTNKKPNGEEQGTRNTAEQPYNQAERFDGAKLQKVADNANVEEEKSSEALFEATKEKFGTTNDLREAGYILPDGTMLDFSGRYMMDDGMDTSHLSGRRAVDHRAIHEVGYDKDENETGFETDMSDFISRGAIRIDANAGTINISKAPTAKQARMLRMLIMLNDGDVSVDFGDGYDSEHYVEYEGARATRVLGDIDRYFNEGIKPQGNISFFRTENGEVYGFVRDGKIYIDPRVASAETPVHEYSHLWADALKRANPEAWERLKETMLGEKDVLEHVKRLYPELEGDELLAEVFSHYSGKRGAERLRADMEREVKNAEGVFAKARVARVFDIIRRALSRFWEMARDLFAGKNSMLNGMRAEDFADMAMNDMLRGFDPRGEEKEIALNETHYHKVTDKAELERLNNEPTVVRYRAMQMIDGKLYPPMSAEVKGELREPTEIGVWERSDERPDLVDKNGKFKLQKGKRFKENKEGQGDTPAAYNPYFHTSTSMMNDQFTAAYVRPELVVVKVEIPESELSSGYKAEKAKDAVGNIPWHSGPVNSALPKERQRTVTLSRYCKVTGVVPDAEVADAIARQLDGLDVAVPYNVVTPNVRAELEARGVKISATPSGSVTRDINGELINRGETAVANEGAVLYEPTARNTGRDIALDDRVSQREYLLSDNYVARLTGNEFAKSDTPLTERVAQFYTEKYGGKVEREGFGMVHLDKRGVKDSLSHGLGRNKAAAFAAVPSIIKDGALIDHKENFKGRNQDSYTLAAPVEIGDKGYVGVVIVTRGKGTDRNKFYLHEVILQKNLLSEEFKTGINTGSKQGENLHEESIKTDTKADSHQGDVAKILKEIVTAKESGEKVANERGSSYRSGSGDVIRFESHAEQLSLFNGGDVAMTSQRTERATERAKRVKEMSDAELLKEMQLDIAEFEKLGRGDWGIQTACTDEYDRRHIKEYNAECERVRTMLDENNVSIEEAEDMLCNAIYSWRDGFATADRSKLLAQFDTLNDYYAEKTDERDNADLYQEVESEQAISETDARNTETPTQQEVAPTTQQTEPAKPKKAAFDPSAIKLRKLKSGESCYVERRYQESGGFDFTGSEKVESDADLAYIFRNLENSSIENTFLVLIKNGKATILHVGMGGYAFSAGHLGAGVLAASQLKPDSVIFVHNHPSGTLQPSQQDIAMQEKVKKMFGADKVREAIIIDITSGKYSIFDSDGLGAKEKQRPTSAENEVPYKTYSFSQQVFAKDYVPDSAFQITDSNKAAEFISGHRLGERDKLSLIVLNRQKRVTGNIFLPWTTLDDIDINKAAGVIAKFIHQMGGESGILYGSGTISRGTLSPLARAISNYEVHLDDFITVEGVSAQVQGVLEDEVKYEAVPLPSEARLPVASRNAEQQPTEVAEDGVGYGEADDSGISDEELAGYDAGRYSFAESITQGLVDLALKNTHDQQLRLNAMREFGGNLAKLRKIMNKQKAYDKGTVDDIVRLARMVMGSGFFKDMSAYEVKRLLAAIKKGVGAEDLTPIANNVVDMLVQHQLRESKNMLHKLMQVRGRKVDARGVEVQAGLDIDGQRMMSALKDGMSLGENGLLTRINDCENRLGSEDEVIRKNAMSEYQGLMLAKEYHDNILSGEEEEIVLRNEKRQEQEKIYDFRREPVLDDDGNAVLRLDGEPRTIERKTLKPQFKNNVTDENKQLRRNTEAAIERIEQSIRESRMERVTSYIDFMSDVAGDVRASRERAAEWRAEQQQRVDEIHHNANSDLLGVDAKTQNREPKQVPLFNPKNSIMRFFFQPLGTFEKFMRYFGRRFHNGEGYLFDRYVRGMIDCGDKEWRMQRALHEQLDKKVTELFGDKKLGKRHFSDLYMLLRDKKHPGIPVEFWDDGERVQQELYQDEALSLVLWSKQIDAEAGLRRMGISEEDIETIKGLLDPKLLEFGDWLVDEFYPSFREQINAVHERMFGAPMAAIEHYFPIVRNKAEVDNEVKDISEQTFQQKLASTIIKSVIKRTRNAAALDVHTSFIDLMLGDIADKSKFVAWSEYYRDLNTLLNYKRFEHKVKNMNSMEFGSGEKLWESFINCCKILTGKYEHSGGTSDELAVNISKGFTTGAIAFRPTTALKQLASLTAFWSDARVDDLLKYQSPWGWYHSWKWAMENLPGFSKRWQSKQIGDTRLMDTDVDWKMWRNNYMKTINRGGMYANAFVDAVTVASGSRAVYETRKRRYLWEGYDEERAERKALQDAANSYKTAQQESEGGYVNEIQVKRTLWAVMRSMFRNASMAYSRRFTTALRVLKDRMHKGYKDDFIEAETKKYKRDGIPDDKARENAERLYRWGGVHAIFDMFNFGWITPYVWTAIAGNMWYLLMGDDDKEKEEILTDGLYRTPFMPIEGLTAGNNVSDIGTNIMRYMFADDKAAALKDLQTQDIFSTPIENEIERFGKDLFSMDGSAVWWDVFSLAIQTNLGFKPETFTDGITAIVDYCDYNPKTTKEFLLLFARVMQAPKSQTDKLFIDELGMTAKDAQKLNAMEMAERYARYKRFREAPLSYVWHTDADEKMFEKYRKRFLDNMQERMEHMDDEQLGWNFENPNDSERRKAVGKVYAKGKGVKDTAGQKPASNWKPETRRSQLKYQRLRDWTDLAEDVLLDTAIEQAKNRGDDEKLKALQDAKKELTEIKRGKHTKTIDINGLGDGSAADDKAIMEELRARRKEILQEYGIIQ